MNGELEEKGVQLAICPSVYLLSDLHYVRLRHAFHSRPVWLAFWFTLERPAHRWR